MKLPSRIQRGLCGSFVALATTGGALGGQGLRVYGVAYDSLAGRPLASAFVGLGTRSAISDSLGRFSFDSISPGTYRATLQHDVLDSLGLPEIVSSIIVRGANDTIRLTTPSSRTMWRRVCPGEQPRDSGFVFGMARDVSRKPIAGADIVASWIELVSVGRGVVQKGWRLDTKSTADGTFMLCGVPVGTLVRLESVRDSTAYAGIEVLLTDRGSVRRQDLMLATVVDSIMRGTIRGTVTAEGQPLSNVRIETDGMPEVRTGVDGGFVLRDVRVGTRQVYAHGIGFSPTSRIVEVLAGDTTRLTITVGKVTLLDSVVIMAATARTRLIEQFNERARVGLGYYRDSIALGKFEQWSAVFTEMTSVVVRNANSANPSITIGAPRGPGPACIPEVWVDRVMWDLTALGHLKPTDIAALEVYRPGHIPAELKALGIGRKVRGPDNACAIVIWTKRGTR